MAALTTTTADATSFGLRGCPWRLARLPWRQRCYGGGYGGCYGGNGCCGCNGGGYVGSHGLLWRLLWDGLLYGCIGGCHSNYAPVPVSPPVVRQSAGKNHEPAEEIRRKAPPPRRPKLIVDLPADAKLFIDDRPMQFTSQHPIFVTPDCKRQDLLLRPAGGNDARRQKPYPIPSVSSSMPVTSFENPSRVLSGRPRTR